MTALLEVIVPVFLVLGFGYVAAWRKMMSDAGIDGLMRFTQGFAIPCLLFRAISELDLAQHFNAPLLFTFYSGAIGGFIAGIAGARLLFKRDWEDSVAIGFCCLFSNTVLLGLPITERAYGTAALTGNFAIIALHAPIGYALGITTMEVVRNRGIAYRALAPKVLRAIFSNALIVGIGLGFVVNLGQITVPSVLTEAIDMMTRAALPAALFGLGGVLYRYRPEGDMRTILFVCAVALILHPLIAYVMGRSIGLPTADLRSAVMTGAMAPGVNAYIFADMYGRARRVAASSVLLATGLTVLTAWAWLAILP